MTSNTPDYIVYVVRDGKEEKSRWSRVGAAWRTKAGDGVRVVLEALPVSGELVLLPPKADEAA